MTRRFDRWIRSALVMGAAWMIAGCGDHDGDPAPQDDVGVSDVSGDGADVAREPGLELRPGSLRLLPPRPLACEGSRQARFPFVIFSQEGPAVAAGDVLDGQMIWPNETLRAGQLGLDAAYMARSGPVCETSQECPEGLRCTAVEVGEGKRYCALPATVSFAPGSVRQEWSLGREGSRELALSVLIQNTASLDGRLPVAVGSLYDESGAQAISSNPERATDAELRHRQMIQDFLISLGGRFTGETAAVSLWFYGGDVGAQTRPLTPSEGGELTNYLTRDLDSLTERLAELPTLIPREANVYQAILRVLDRDLGLEAYEEAEKVLVVFTDSPNQVYDAQADAEAVRARLEATGVRLMIVHLDPELDASLLRDLPSQWGGNQACREDASCAAPTCEDDASCQPHERCRPATIYAEEAGGTVEQTAESYCLPARDAEGRVGPVQEYAELTCASGGHYVYAADVDDMVAAWNVLAPALQSTWSVEGTLPELDALQGPGFGRLSGSFSARVGPAHLGDRLRPALQSRVSADSRPAMLLP
ncbi:VWA domain-containing protein [Lujinxingia sediminis]|uniref:VWA domain-containing protein n=1 Tax=Lujinxingia sediminis TaxID=2480984 RepID=A0ABY0CQI4_9DELT|nr:vWA domain-containing protein [Lujinxingia sediminis]RVU42330.1 VWA domain-containing protein [Lujinxingia sediminis]